MLTLSTAWFSTSGSLKLWVIASPLRNAMSWAKATPTTLVGVTLTSVPRSGDAVKLNGAYKNLVEKAAMIEAFLVRDV